MCLVDSGIEVIFRQQINVWSYWWWPAKPAKIERNTCMKCIKEHRNGNAIAKNSLIILCSIFYVYAACMRVFCALLLLLLLAYCRVCATLTSRTHSFTHADARKAIDIHSILRFLARSLFLWLAVHYSRGASAKINKKRKNKQNNCLPMVYVCVTCIWLVVTLHSLMLCADCRGAPKNSTMTRLLLVMAIE